MSFLYESQNFVTLQDLKRDWYIIYHYTFLSHDCSLFALLSFVGEV